MVCPNMKLTTAEKILWCLEDMSGEVTVDEETAGRARHAIERMLAVVPRAAGAGR
jgi:quinolinate synthase